MKKYLIASILLGAFFVSCKKERTCNCTVSDTGSRTTHSQTSGFSFTFPPLPSVPIIPAKDTTMISPYSYSSTNKKSYDEMSKRTAKKLCPESFEESYSDEHTTIIAGTSTVTTTESGTRAYSCKIE